MTKLSPAVKEIIKTVAFLIVVGVVVFFYMIYPLNRSKATTGRPGLDDYNPDSLVANDIAAYIEAGVCDTSLTATASICDTFWVETDGLTTIACLWLVPPAGVDSARGTIFLLHDDGADRDAMAPLARTLVDSGYCVVAYDQRAAGRSSRQYRGEGQYEADDLQEIIRHLDLRSHVIHPVVVVGWSTGADAGLLCSRNESRIDGVIAVSPYLSSERWLDVIQQRHETMWFPFSNTIMWWWYEIRSSYAAPFRELEDIRSVACRTLVMADDDIQDCDEVVRLKEVSEAALLQIGSVPITDEEMTIEILDFVVGLSEVESEAQM
ncbi:MAG: alpha/beta hydrolase [candidate division Zixibacteria bacterium]|nr:alpha/beta hydrolase [candidate division Zixibacteria bacterium]